MEIKELGVRANYLFDFIRAFEAYVIYGIVEELVVRQSVSLR